MSGVVLSDHARARCVEMDVRTKRVKRIVADPDVDRPATRGARIATRADEPYLAVVYVAAEGTSVVLTVVYRIAEVYDRSDETLKELTK